MPASVRQQLKDVMPHEGFEAKYQLLFTLAHTPGIVLPSLTGLLVDRIGGRTCIMVLSSICCLGEAVASVGIQRESWSIALTGRLIYGLGFESLFVANGAFLSSEFDKKRLGMALGVSGAASYVGYLLSFAVSPKATD